MIVTGPILRWFPTNAVRFMVSNIRPTVIQRQMQGLKTTFSPPITLIDPQTAQTYHQIKDQHIAGRPNGVQEASTVESKNQSPTYIHLDPSSSTKRVLKARQQDQQSSQLRIVHERNIGMNLFINRVYITTGASLMLAFGTIHVASSIPLFVMNPLMCIGYGTAMTLGGMISSYYIRPHIVVEEEEGYEHIKTRNGIIRSSLFTIGWMGVGLAAMPFSNMLASLMPMLVPNLMGMTLGCFGGASLVIGSMPRLPLFTYGGLVGGLLGSLVSMKLIKQFHAMIYGQNFFSNFIQTLDMYTGTFIFTFFIVYNTMKARQAYLAGNPDHFEISLKFYYDMIKYIQKVFNFVFKKKFD